MPSSHRAPQGGSFRRLPVRLSTRRTVAAGLAALAVATVGCVQSAPPAAATGALSGVNTSNGPSGTTSFGTWRARTVGVAHAFAPGGTWSSIELPSTWTGYWSKSIYRTKMMISLPMLPSSQSATLSQGASGAYDAYFKTTAQHLVAAGMGNAILRVGWEFNGGWFKWSAKSNPSAYAAYYRHIVTAMRSVSGQSFRFVWSPSNGYYGWDPRTAWPGNSYVNYVGDGLYDCWWRHASATPSQRWNQLLYLSGGVPGGLAFWTNFAASKGKPLVFPEWGLVNSTASMCGGSGGGGDDAYFVQQVYNWTVNHSMAWETYFNHDANDGAHTLTDTQFKNAAALYRKLFGGA